MKQPSGSSIEELGFDSELLLYSYETEGGQTSPLLFNLARDTLAKRGIKSSECLYLGNDMLNDVWRCS
ncbi:hypothetical protein MASR2M78_28650 [Treponema sp.]